MSNEAYITLDDMPGEFRAVAELIGIKQAIALVTGFGGCQLYIPKMDTLARKKKNRMMYDYFIDCCNYKRVAVKYGLSESRTRQIIKHERMSRLSIQERQGKLF